MVELRSPITLMARSLGMINAGKSVIYTEQCMLNNPIAQRYL